MCLHLNGILNKVVSCKDTHLVSKTKPHPSVKSYERNSDSFSGTARLPRL